MSHVNVYLVFWCQLLNSLMSVLQRCTIFGIYSTVHKTYVIMYVCVYAYTYVCIYMYIPNGSVLQNQKQMTLRCF